MSSDRSPVASTSGGRYLSLDALRGVAVMGMMFAGVIPWDGLPRWMYHGQEPPPSHDFNPNLAALTWVDLVFPFFLFSMGAAIPLALARRVREGERFWESAWVALKRFALLVAFAIMNQHLRPYTLASSPDNRVWGIALLGFLVVFLIYVRLPVSWPKPIAWAIRAAGWGILSITLSRLHYPSDDMPTFTVHRGDPIILVLATCSLFGTLTWLQTRNKPRWRLWVMAAIFAWRISALETGSWADTAWGYDGPIGWAFQPSYLCYLLVLIPGTLVGDLLVGASSAKRTGKGWPDFGVGALAFATIPFSLYVFLDRVASAWLLPLAALQIWLGSREEKGLIRSLLTWGGALLALGALLEPFQGGIKKDHPTLSYVIVTPGLAMLFLVCLIFTLQIIRRKSLRAIWRKPRLTNPHLNLATQTGGLSYAI